MVDIRQELEQARQVCCVAARAIAAWEPLRLPPKLTAKERRRLGGVRLVVGHSWLRHCAPARCCVCGAGSR
eukprot:5633807-Lingulodinium_polyedra.AAC.1